MPDTQGRGSAESRIELPNQRARENGSATTAAAATSAALAALQTQVQGSTNAQLSGGSSVSAPNFEQQILLLTKLKTSLEKFRADVMIAADNYEQSVAFLGAHIIENMSKSYTQKYLAVTKSKAKDLTDHIAARDIKAIEEKIRDLQAMAAKYNSL